MPLTKKRLGTLSCKQSGKSKALSLEQYNIIIQYITTRVKPSLQTLKDADMLALAGEKCRAKFGPLYFLKSWASRMSYNSVDGRLFLRSNGKTILPKEHFTTAIKSVHTSGVKHLTLTATVAKIKELFTVGPQQFGIGENLIKAVVLACKEGSCGKYRQQSSTASSFTGPIPQLSGPYSTDNVVRENSGNTGTNFQQHALGLHMQPHSTDQGSPILIEDTTELDKNNPSAGRSWMILPKNFSKDKLPRTDRNDVSICAVVKGDSQVQMQTFQSQSKTFPVRLEQSDNTGAKSQNYIQIFPLSSNNVPVNTIPAHQSCPQAFTVTQDARAPLPSETTLSTFLPVPNPFQRKESTTVNASLQNSYTVVPMKNRVEVGGTDSKHLGQSQDKLQVHPFLDPTSGSTGYVETSGQNACSSKSDSESSEEDLDIDSNEDQTEEEIELIPDPVLFTKGPAFWNWNRQRRRRKTAAQILQEEELLKKQTEVMKLHDELLKLQTDNIKLETQLIKEQLQLKLQKKQFAEKQAAVIKKPITEQVKTSTKSQVSDPSSGPSNFVVKSLAAGSPVVISSDSCTEAEWESPSQKKIKKIPVPKPEIPPYPHIWKYFQDICGEKDLYSQMTVCIQDMKLDLYRSLLSDKNSVDRLKKKIGFTETLVRKQKTFTAKMMTEMD